MENYGLIIRHLRGLAGLTVRETAQKIGRSIGWLSEIENGCGTARLTEEKLNNIVDGLGGSAHRAMFKTWVSNYKRMDGAERIFEGAILKFVRTKKKLNLDQAAQLLNLQIGRLLRALIATIIAFRFWKLHKFPLEQTGLARWLWISGWCVVKGLWGYALFLNYGVHLLHITFVGGFSLMALMIATRVTLAHGDHGYDLEGSSKALKWAGILILAAMLTRVLAPLMMSLYRTHLGYASLVWILSITWAWVFIKKIFVLSKTDSH